MELYKPDQCLKMVMKLSEKYPDIFAELSQEIKSISEESYTTDESSADESSADESNSEYNIICSPIPIKKKTVTQLKKGIQCARTDFEEQENRNRHILDGNLFWCWDDGVKNKGKVGDIFIFWDYDGTGKGGRSNPWGGGKFNFHKVISVRNPSERLPSWSGNVGHGHRNVLELSAPKFTLTYDEMIKYGAKPDYHGTNYPKTGFERGSPLIKMIDEQFK